MFLFWIQRRLRCQRWNWYRNSGNLIPRLNSTSKRISTLNCAKANLLRSSVYNAHPITHQEFKHFFISRVSWISNIFLFPVFRRARAKVGDHGAPNIVCIAFWRQFTLKCCEPIEIERFYIKTVKEVHVLDKYMYFFVLFEKSSVHVLAVYIQLEPHVFTKKFKYNVLRN